MSGRITPSTFGRTTPSLFNGRVTPSMPNGRVTPARGAGRVTPSTSFGFTTPSARVPSKPSIPPPENAPSSTAMNKITAGSRASKYIGMTAQQLSARGSKSPVITAPASPSSQSSGFRGSPRSLGSPSPSRSELASPSSGTGATPKAVTRLPGLGTPKRFGSGRPSQVTPKPRIPSAVAMPPPPSPPSGGSNRSLSISEKPLTPTYSTASNDTAVEEESLGSLPSIQQNSRALHDKIQGLLKSKGTSDIYVSSDALHPSFGDDAPRPRSVAHVDYEKIRNLEEENAQLQIALSELSTKQDLRASMPGEFESLKDERDQALLRIQDLEGQLKASERSLNERLSKVSNLERSIQSSATELESVRADRDARLRDLETKLEDNEHLVSRLKEAIEVKSNEAGQNEGVIQAKNAEIGLLEGRVKKANSELEDVRRDLISQVEELRRAGQETIALYEERLSTSEMKRYELEDRVQELEELSKKRTSVGHTSLDDSVDGVSKIDNEMLRDQVSHLQKKIQDLEDQLEDTRANAEREEAALRSRVQRYKESEASLRSETTEIRKEVESLTKSEAVARAKAEEAEEALRENTFALENARAEIESLRAEVAVSDSTL